MYRRSTCAIAALALVFCLNSKLAAQGSDDPVVAIVDDYELHLSDVLAARNSLPEEYRNLPMEQMYGPLRERLIDTRLLAERAESEGMADDPVLVRTMEQIRAAMLRDALIEREIAETITEDSLRQTFEERKSQDDFGSTEVHARHVLVETEDEANEVIAALDGGADFVEIAKERSTGPSGPNGGDLGYFKKEAMVPEFAEVAFAMEPGSYTDTPVQTQFGWHVILVEDKRVTEPTFEEFEPELRTEKTNEILQELVSSVREGAAIERFKSDGTPE